MPTCDACPTFHRAFSTPRVERLTSNLADALRQIAKQTQNGKVFVKVPAYQFAATHARLALWAWPKSCFILADLDPGRPARGLGGRPRRACSGSPAWSPSRPWSTSSPARWSAWAAP